MAWARVAAICLFCSAALPATASAIANVLHFYPSTHGLAVAEAVMLSGDGGWKELEDEFAENLAGRGVGVTGIDSSQRFDVDRSVDKIADYLDVLASRKRPIVLIGYSFGADLVPLVWPKLDAETRARIVEIVLMAPTFDGSTKIDPTNVYSPAVMSMIELSRHHANLPKDRLVCVYGVEEAKSGYSSCPGPNLKDASLMPVAGGHHLGGAAGKIALRIADIIRDSVLRVAATRQR